MSCRSGKPAFVRFRENDTRDKTVWSHVHYCPTFGCLYLMGTVFLLASSRGGGALTYSYDCPGRRTFQRRRKEWYWDRKVVSALPLCQNIAATQISFFSFPMLQLGDLFNKTCTFSWFKWNFRQFLQHVRNETGILPLVRYFVGLSWIAKREPIACPIYTCISCYVFLSDPETLATAPASTKTSVAAEGDSYTERAQRGN